MGPTAAADAERIHARRWWTLLTLCLCITVIGVDNTILNVALPTLVMDLRASTSQLQWIVDASMRPGTMRKPKPTTDGDAAAGRANGIGAASRTP